MDINTRLDGFIVHPLDAFNDKHHDDNIPKFSNTAPNLDGFKVHPIDSFIIHKHDNSSNFNDNFTTTNYGTINQVDNLDYLSNNQTYDLGNISSQYNFTNNLGVYQTQNQDLISMVPSINNDINIDQLLSGNISNYESYVNYNNSGISYDQYPSTNINYDYTGNTSSNIITLNTTDSTNYINNTSYSTILPTVYRKAIINNSNNYINSNAITQNTVYTAPAIITPLKRIVRYNIPKIRKVKTLPSTQIAPVFGNFKKSGYVFRHIPSVVRYNSSSAIVPLNKSYSPMYKTIPYSVTTFEPDVNWNSMLPKRTTIIVPTKRSVIIPRTTTIVVPKKQTIIIPKPVLVQQKNVVVPTIQVAMPPTGPQVVPNLQNYKIVSGSALVPTIPVINPQQNLIPNKIEKFPMDNMKRIIDQRIISNPQTGSKIYVPKDFAKK